MTTDEIADIPGMDENGASSGDQVPLSFNGRIDYGYLYHRMFSGLQHLHATNQDTRAHELFYSSISDFGSLWDLIFVENFVKVQNKFPDDVVSQYRFHKVEFARLLQRAGIAPRPDVRLVIKPAWEVPKTIEAASGTKHRVVTNDGTEETQDVLCGIEDDDWDELFAAQDGE